METTEIYAESTKRNLAHVLCQNEATLVYLANLGCIEIHPWNARVGSLDKPDYLVIDLDLGEKHWDEVVEVALVVKAVMDRCGAACYCKTSGATGMYIFSCHWPGNTDLRKQRRLPAAPRNWCMRSCPP